MAHAAATASEARREDGEATVAFAARPHQDAIVLGDHGFDQLVVARACLPHRLREVIPEPRTADNVGKQERNRPKAAPA